MSELSADNPNHLEYANDLFEVAVLGGIRLTGLDRMRVTLKVSLKEGSAPAIRHNLDLYNDGQCERYIRKVAERFEVGTTVVAATIGDLIEKLESYRLEQAMPADKKKKALSPDEVQAAQAFLEQPNLLERTNELIGQSGVIGEETNRLLMYLVFTSRKMPRPLHVVSLGASGMGKTHLQEKVGALIPEEDTLSVTSLSENSFYYFGQEELRHKLILIEDLDGLAGSGATGAFYALRELQSKRRISKTIAHKTSQGETKTVHLVVEGPVCVSGCTTRASLYEDNANRSFLLFLDESPEQDERIMAYQRAMSAGKINSQDEREAQGLLRNTQRVLEPIAVRNPYAERLILPGAVFKPRRTNAHYLAFIEAVTFYCQKQRQVKTDRRTGERYIETTLEDIEAANQLLKEVLLRKSDELSGACRNYFERLKTYLKERESTSAEDGTSAWTSREVRLALRVSGTTYRRYQRELLEQGYIRIKGGERTTGYTYEITSPGEYEELKAGVETVLDEVLDRLCASEPVVRHPRGGSPKSQKISAKHPVRHKTTKMKETPTIGESAGKTLAVLQAAVGKWFTAREVSEITGRIKRVEGRNLKKLYEAGHIERVWESPLHRYRAGNPDR